MTGWFALFRSVYQLGKPLLIGAALHNLGEWGFISFVFYRYPLQRRYTYIISLFWIWFIIISVISILTFPEYALVEQVSGIALDFALAMVYVVLYAQAKAAGNREEMDLWLLVIIASWVHLWGTIIPLVIENFVVYQSDAFSGALEALIAFSAPITHILYTRWVTLYDRIIATNPVYSQRQVVSKPECLRDISCGQNEICCQGQGCVFCFWFIIAVLLGLLPTTIIPAIIGPCTETAELDGYSPTGVK